MEYKICRKCKEEKEIKLFARDNHYKGGIGTLCNVCNTKKYMNWFGRVGKVYLDKNRDRINKSHKKYRQSTKGKKVQIEKANRMRLLYPEKWSARAKLRNAVKVGKIIKLPCEFCGDIKSQGHHEDYLKPLEVKWLCMKHHRIVHNCH